MTRERHHESSHRRRVGTQKVIVQTFWWPVQWKQVEDYVRSGEECQFRATVHYANELHPMFGP